MFEQTGPFTDPAAHIRSELPERLVALRNAQHRHIHAAGCGHPAHVVAKQIDDDHVLGTFFGAADETLNKRLVLRLSASTGRSALHRPGQQPVPDPLEEQLGTSARDHVLAHVQVCPVVGPLVQRQICVHLRHIALDLRAQTGRQVALVDVACRDVLADTGDVAVVFRAGPARPPRCGAVVPVLT
jgi:hypothetical protein